MGLAEAEVGVSLCGWDVGSANVGHERKVSDKSAKVGQELVLHLRSCQASEGQGRITAAN